MIVEILFVILVLGHLLQIVLGRDDWPFSCYSMYSHLINDSNENPYLILIHDNIKYQAGFLGLVAHLEDESEIVLTNSFAHKLIKPYDRLRTVRYATELYRSSSGVDAWLKDLAGWVATKPETRAMKVKRIELRLFLWHEIPFAKKEIHMACLLYTSPSPRDRG